MSLFQKGNFKLHSNKISDFKIECDDLTLNDIKTLAYLISKRFKFFSVFGVPTGGLALAAELKQYCSNDLNDPTLIVDDVLTTGKSMIDFIRKSDIKNPFGVAIFARTHNFGEWGIPIIPIFQMW